MSAADSARRPIGWSETVRAGRVAVNVRAGSIPVRRQDALLSKFYDVPMMALLVAVEVTGHERARTSVGGANVSRKIS